MAYKFVYGYNLDSSGHESDDESSTKKKKSSSGKVWVGVVLLLVAALTGALLVDSDVQGTPNSVRAEGEMI